MICAGVIVSPLWSGPQQAMLYMVLNAHACSALALISMILDLKLEGIMISGSDVQHSKSLLRLRANEKYLPAETVLMLLLNA